MSAGRDRKQRRGTLDLWCGLTGSKLLGPSAISDRWRLWRLAASESESTRVERRQGFRFLEATGLQVEKQRVSGFEVFMTLAQKSRRLSTGNNARWNPPMSVRAPATRLIDQRLGTAV